MKIDDLETGEVSEELDVEVRSDAFRTGKIYSLQVFAFLTDQLCLNMSG